MLSLSHIEVLSPSCHEALEKALDRRNLGDPAAGISLPISPWVSPGSWSRLAFHTLARVTFSLQLFHVQKMAFHPKRKLVFIRQGTGISFIVTIQ